MYITILLVNVVLNEHIDNLDELHLLSQFFPLSFISNALRGAYGTETYCNRNS